MCTPAGLVGMATGIRPLDEANKRISRGLFGGGDETKPTQVTNNYYNRTADEAAAQNTPNKDTLKAGNK